MPLPIEHIIARLNEPVDVVHMSIGWLIRENYVRVVRGNAKYVLIVTKNVRRREVCHSLGNSS
jgi:hypothetical protein